MYVTRPTMAHLMKGDCQEASGNSLSTGGAGKAAVRATHCAPAESPLPVSRLGLERGSEQPPERPYLQLLGVRSESSHFPHCLRPPKDEGQAGQLACNAGDIHALQGVEVDLPRLCGCRQPAIPAVGQEPSALVPEDSAPARKRPTRAARSVGRQKATQGKPQRTRPQEAELGPGGSAPSCPPPTHSRGSQGTAGLTDGPTCLHPGCHLARGCLGTTCQTNDKARFSQTHILDKCPPPTGF